MIRSKIPPDISIYLRYLYQDKGVKGKELINRFPQYKRSTIYRHAKLPIGVAAEDKRHRNKGRPQVLDERDKRCIIRELPRLRQEHGRYTIKRILLHTGLEDKVSRRTASRFLNTQGLRYLHTRKKGLMTINDLKRRVKFAQQVKRVNPAIWTEGMSFYLDGVGFVHKTNPQDEALAPKGMLWRRRNEGLKLGNTSKGKKEGVNGRVAKYIVCISYTKGVICCKRYEAMNGEYFRGFIESNFESILAKSNSPQVKRFLQDGDPSQNSAICKLELERMGMSMFSIPPRSPDLNPIENLFNNVKEKLNDDAILLNIKKETFEEFCTRVEQTLENFDKNIIDKTILSMDKRIDLIIQGKGKRLKY